MPVSKKRKKDGKPVHRRPPEEPAAHPADHPDAKPDAPQPRTMGRPTNPFVAQQQAKRGSQRGR
jgi:hypothetical protein